MSLLPSPQEVVLASPMEGTLTFNGKPISGVKIQRKLSWYDDEGRFEDFVVTNTNGHFILPVIKDTVKVSGLMPLVISQEISARHNGEDVLIWALGKDSKIEYGELGGKPVNMRCELSNEKRITRDYNTPMMTRCTWDSLEPWVDTENPG